jgi:hypothetical protein
LDLYLTQHNLILPDTTRLISNTYGVHRNPAGGYQEGPAEFNIFINSVEIFSFDISDFDIDS